MSDAQTVAKVLDALQSVGVPMLVACYFIEREGYFRKEPLPLPVMDPRIINFGAGIDKVLEGSQPKPPVAVIKTKPTKGCDL